jgi:hypothetical protein
MDYAIPVVFAVAVVGWISWIDCKGPERLAARIAKLDNDERVGISLSAGGINFLAAIITACTWRPPIDTTPGFLMLLVIFPGSVVVGFGVSWGLLHVANKVKQAKTEKSSQLKE